MNKLNKVPQSFLLKNSNSLIRKFKYPDPRKSAVLITMKNYRSQNQN